MRGRSPLTAYERDAFAPRWADVDRDGCDSRNEVLRRHLVDETVRQGGCVVLTGVLIDPYIGQRIGFSKAYAGAVQVDHVVALGERLAEGGRPPAGQAPTRIRRRAAEPARDRAGEPRPRAPATPASRVYRCEYVARQVAVKARYQVAVTPAERAAIARVLARCPGEPLPTDA